MRHFFAAALLATAACAQAQPAAAPAPEVRADAVLNAVPLADGHNDWPYALRLAHGPQGALTADLENPVRVKSASQFATGGETTGHTSIPLLRQGRLGLQLWSVYVPSTLAADEAVKQTFEQIGVAKSLATRRPDTFAMVTTADQALKEWKAGRIAGIIALEGAHQIADDIPTLRRVHAQGVRAMTLTHSRATRLFDSATDKPVHNGMGPGGAEMIAEMNRLGVLVDLSHVSPAVMNQVLDVTKSPVVFTHSSAKAITNHPRNVPDDVLRRLKANGGLIMITFVPAFIDQRRADWQSAREAVRAAAGPDAEAKLKAWDEANPRPVSTLAMVADHIDHAARVAGHDHVGIGGDFDGIPDTPQGLENVSTYPALFAELARRGWTDANLRKLAGENFLRVLRANEATAKALSR